MSLIESLASLLMIVPAAVLVEALTHHWLAEIFLYAVLAMFGSTAAFFVYGGVIDQLHSLKTRFRSRRSRRATGSEEDQM